MTETGLTAVEPTLLDTGKEELRSKMKVEEQHVNHASAGNRARATSMATMYSTARPLMLLGKNAIDLDAEIC